MRRAWLTEMGEEFHDWANSYYPDHEQEEILKITAEAEAKKYAEWKNYRDNPITIPNF